MKKNIVVFAAVALLMLGSLVSRAEACNCNKSKTSAAPKVSDALAAKLLPSYLAIRASLAADNVTGVDTNANVFIKTLNDAIANARKDKKSKEYIGALEGLAKSAGSFTEKGLDLKSARQSFGSLSDAFVSWAKANLSAKDAEKHQLYYCGMAKRHWLQEADREIGNPYYGTAMADCGEKTPMSAASACGKGTCGQNCDKNSCSGQSQGHDMHNMSGMQGM